MSPTQSLKLLKSKKAGGFLGFLFLLIGTFGFLYAVKVSVDERRAKNWISHVAQIERAVLATHVNNNGHKSFSVDVAYQFEWNGRVFKGNTYRLHDKSDGNYLEYNKVVESLLLSKQDEGEYPIFVNPDNPTQSALQNTVHPKASSSSLFLGVLFSTMGLFLVFGPNVFRRRERSV